MTEPVLDAIKNEKNLLVRVSPNMTHLYQPLDLTVNGSAKEVFRRMFSEWYSGQLTVNFDNG